MVLTERDRAVLRDVAELEVVSRPQLQRLGHFGSRTRANAVLARLVQFGYLSSRVRPVSGGSKRLLYQLGPTATDNPRNRRMKTLSDLFLDHHLMASDVRISFRTNTMPKYDFDRWVSDIQLHSLKLGVVPDGYAEYRHADLRFAAFIEADRATETLGTWEKKTHAYLKLAHSSAFYDAFKLRFFRVLVITTSEGRLASLQRAVGRTTEQLFWFTTHEQLVSEGPFAAIWRRPSTSQLHSLIERK